MSPASSSSVCDAQHYSEMVVVATLVSDQETSLTRTTVSVGRGRGEQLDEAGEPARKMHVKWVREGEKGWDQGLGRIS